MAKKSTDLSKDIPANMAAYKESFVAATKETITELQKQNSISNRQLAIKGKIAPSTMTDILTHNAMPTMNTVIGIVRGGLKMKLSEFFAIVETKTEPGSSETSLLPILIEKIQALPREEQMSLLGRLTAYEARLQAGQKAEL